MESGCYLKIFSFPDSPRTVSETIWEYLGTFWECLSTFFMCFLGTFGSVVGTYWERVGNVLGTVFWLENGLGMSGNGFLDDKNGFFGTVWDLVLGFRDCFWPWERALGTLGMNWDCQQGSGMSL